MAWANGFFAINFDPAVVRLIPVGPFLHGSEITAPWRMWGGNVAVNGNTGIPGLAIVNLFNSSNENVTLDVHFWLRFEVLSDAPIGAVTEISWNSDHVTQGFGIRIQGGVGVLDVASLVSSDFATVIIGQMPANPVTVTFNPNGGTLAPGGRSRAISFGETLANNATGAAMPNDPSHREHAFIGWVTADGFPFNETTVVTSDTEVFAQFDMGREGWYQLDGLWFFYVSGHRQMGWFDLGTALVYFIPEQNGALAIGLVVIDGVTHEFAPDGAWIREVEAQEDGWHQIDGHWVLYANGIRQMGWHNLGHAIVYFISELGGALATGFVVIDGVTHEFGPDGAWIREIEAREDGWHQIDGHWVLYANGTRQMGWHNLGHAIVYFIPELGGALATGFVVIEGVTHEFGADGAWIREVAARPDGWHQIDSNWVFYVGGNRQMGWFNLGTALVYFIPEQSGALAIGLVVIDGVTHEFGADGAWIREVAARPDGWHQIDGSWVFYVGGTRQMGWFNLETALVYFIPEQNGALAIGLVVIEGVTHEFDLDGAWIRQIETREDGWHQIYGNWVFYVGGIRQMGWLNTGTALVYFIPEQNGALAIGTVIINGVAHEFGADGAWIREVM